MFLTMHRGMTIFQVITINLAHNSIKSLGAFRTLHKQGFTIRNLCFDNNSIERFTELDALRNLPLRELVLTNNPVSKLDEEKYMRYAASMRALLVSNAFVVRLRADFLSWSSLT